MTATEAARLLELPPDATPEQLEARFLELRTKLEDRIAKSPTPGLKAKYRESLDGITVAFETLTLAADCSALPVLQRGSSVAGGSPVAGVVIPGGSSRASTLTQPVSATPMTTTTPASRPARKSGGGKEFFTVALIAIAVLGAGGWWVMKTRTENEEKARVAVEMKTEADRMAAAEKLEQERKAEVARLAVEAQKNAELTEKARVAAAEKAERERLEKVLAQTSAQLVNLRIAWEAVEQDARKAERRLNELRTEERTAVKEASGPELAHLRAEIAGHTYFHEWIESQLGRHDAKVLRAQAEAMIAVRQYDEAARIATQAVAAQSALDGDIAATRAQMLTLSGTLKLDVKPAAAEWALTDAYGVKRKGKGAAELKEVPWGPVVLEIVLSGYESKRLEGTLTRGQPGLLAHEFKPAVVRIDSVPRGAEVSLGGRPFGTTPASIEWPGDGEQKLTLKLRGYDAVAQTLPLVGGGVLDLGAIALRPAPKGVTRPDFNLGPLRYEVAMQRAVSSRSTNTYSPTSPTTFNFSLHSDTRVEIDTPTESSADATRVRFTTISHVNDGKAMFSPGTVRECIKVQAGWLMKFKNGGFVDPELRVHQKDSTTQISPVAHRAMVDSPEWWPTEEMHVDDTWDVPVTAMKSSGLATLLDLDQRGKITGRVISVRRDENQHVAEVEFTFDVASARRSAESTMQYHSTGRVNCTVDLRHHHISTVNYTVEDANTIELTSSNYKTDTTSTTTGSVAVRPL
jgi:hypothetical protein